MQKEFIAPRFETAPGFSADHKGCGKDTASEAAQNIPAGNIPARWSSASSAASSTLLSIGALAPEEARDELKFPFAVEGSISCLKLCIS
jgi:hypothetical protein